MTKIERSPDEIRAILVQMAELQELDREMIQVRQQMAVLPPKLRALDARLAQEQQAIEKLGEGKTDSSHERRKMEKEVRELEEEIEKHQKRQMEVKTNKEYAAVNLEIDLLRRKIDAVETRILEGIEKEEAHERRVTQARQKYDRLRAESQQERQRIEEQIRTKNEKIARLNSERDRRRQAIPADALALYDRLSERHPGEVVCPAVRSHCGGCHINLVNQKMLEIRQMKTFVRCEGCLRIFSSEVEE
jgi:hypothetical protein